MNGKLKLLLGILAFTGMYYVGSVEARLNNDAGLYNTDSNRNGVDLIVYNEDNVAHEVGDVVIYVSTPTSGAAGVSISTTSTLGDGRAAGVVVENDCAANSWCKIRVQGYVSQVNLTGSGVLGGALVASATAEVAVSTAAPTDAVTPGIFGVSLTADSDGAVAAILFR